MILQVILSIIGIIILIVTIVFLIVTRKAADKVSVEPNSPFVEIDDYRRRFTEGHQKGIRKSLKLRPNGFYFLEFYPTDGRQGENIERPKIQRVIVAQEYLKIINGVYRTTIKTISRNPADLPKELIDTIEGNNEIKESQIAFIKKTFSETIPNTDSEIQEIIHHSNRGIGKDFIEKLKDNSRALNQINNPETKPTNKEN